MTVTGTRNWSLPKDPKYQFDDIGFRRRNKFIAKPIIFDQLKPIEAERIQGRILWKDVGKNQEIRRMFVSSAFSMFAETMRPSLETALGEVLESFSDVIIKSVPYWDLVSEEDKDAWALRAKIEKKKDHYIYMRKVPIRDKPEKIREIVATEFEECESDPDEIPGEMIPHDEANPVTLVAVIHEEVKSLPAQVTITPKPVYGHRADALQHWVPANRQVRFLDEPKHRSSASYTWNNTNKHRPHHNFKHFRENYHTRDVGLMDH